MSRRVVMIALFLLALTPLSLVFAQQPPRQIPVPQGQGPIQTVSQGIDRLNQVLVWVATIFWIVAAIFVLYAGFLYLTAGGDPEKVQKANHQLIYAVVSIIVGVMAFVLPRLVESFLQGQ